MTPTSNPPGDTSTQTPQTTSWSGTRRSFPARIQRAILQRDTTCVLCQTQPATEADHRIPHYLCLALGIEADTLDNGQGLCSTCHRVKTLEEIRQARHYTNRPARDRDKEKHPGFNT